MSERLVIESGDGMVAVPFGAMYAMELPSHEGCHRWSLNISGECLGIFTDLEMLKEQKRKILKEWVDVARGAGARIYTVETE